MTDAVDTYLADLNRAVGGRPGREPQLVAEARDHLRDATEALREEGLPPEQAARRAVADFGTVAVLAPQYRRTVAARWAGNCLLALVAVMSLNVTAWWAMSEPADASTPVGPWITAISAVGWVAIGVAMVMAAPVRPRREFPPRAVLVFTIGVSAVLLGMAGAMNVILPSADGAIWTLLLVWLPFGVTLSTAARGLRHT